MFIAAEAREFRGLLRRCEDVRRLAWPLRWVRSVRLRGREAVLVANGMGAKCSAEAAEVVRRHVEPDAIVSYGFCGALDPDLALSAVLVASEVRWPGGALPALAPRTSRSYATGVLLSGEHVVCTAREKRELRATGAAAVEMEAAGLAPLVRQWSLRFFCVRAVSDTASEDLPLDFNAMRGSDGQLRQARIVSAALRHPLAIAPGLWRLREATHAASEALGDFVADCQF